jgi:hypothetical protein
MLQNKLKIRHVCIALFFSICSVSAIIAQEAPFVIKDVDFQVKGRTMSFVLMQKIRVDGPVIGRSFGDKDSLEAYIADRRQILLDTRLFASVDASFDLSPREAGGTDALLHFAIVDTWNIVALPKPTLNPNVGQDYYIKIKDYDFLGSMQPLSVNPEVSWDKFGNFSESLTTSFGVPFQTLGADWSLGVSETAQVWNSSAALSETSTSLTYNIPGLPFPASITASQGYDYNADVQYPNYPEPDPNFLSESLSGTANIPVGLSFGSLGKVYYDPSFSYSKDWWPTAAMYYPGRVNPGLYIGNMLTAGRLDWVGDMRQGSSLSLTSGTTVGVSDTIEDLNLTFTGTWQYAESIGFTARLVAMVRPAGNFAGGPPPLAEVIASLPISNDYLTGLGSNLRGIIDDRIIGVGGIFGNLSLPIKLFDFPTHIIVKREWLDFELQAQPFVDSAVVLPTWQTKLGSGNLSQWLWASGGLELLFFPAFMRNFIIRVGCGWDLVAIMQNHSLTAAAKDGQSPYEYSFGTGLAY